MSHVLSIIRQLFGMLEKPGVPLLERGCLSLGSGEVETIQDLASGEAGRFLSSLRPSLGMSLGRPSCPLFQGQVTGPWSLFLKEI